MRLYDRSGEGQAEPHSGRLCCEEGFENIGELVRGDAGAGIGNREFDLCVIQSPGLGNNIPLRSAAIAYGFNTIHRKIDHNLLQMNGITVNR